MSSPGGSRPQPPVEAMASREVAVTSRHPRLRFRRRDVARMIEVLDANARSVATAAGSVPPGELSVVFLTDAALATLHAEFLGDPSTTDVITFEGDPALGVAGEICVSVDTAQAYARRHRHDFSTELALYVVHGWLHLAGYDDLAPARKRAMRRAEARAMRMLQRERAVPAFTLRAGAMRG